MIRKWRRVSAGNPCPVCGKTDWCTFTDDGEMSCCMRVQNDRQAANGGYLYVRDGETWVEPRRRSEGYTYAYPVVETRGRGVSRALAGKFNLPRTSVDDLREEMEADRGHSYAMADMAEYLLGCGYCDELLRAVNALGVYLSKKFSGKCATLAFPMRDAQGRAVGIRYREMSGKKWSYKGGSDGLFYSPRQLSELHASQLFIVEGATDALALMLLGIPVVGRSSCGTGKGFISEVVKARRIRSLVILADRDSTHVTEAGAAYMPGRNGAIALAKAVGVPCAIVFLRNHKDVKDFITSRLKACKPIEDIRAELLKIVRDTPPTRA